MATGSITKHVAKDGTISYRARADGGPDPASGKRRQVLKTHRTKTAAQTWLREQQRRADEGLWADGGKMTLGDWITQWLAGPGARNRRPTTVRTYAVLLARVTAALGHVPLAKLRPAALETFFHQQEEQLRPASVQTLYAALRVCLEAAVRLQVLAVNPLLRVQPPQVPAGTRPSWTPAQARTALAAAEPGEEHAVLTVLLHTGIRIGELLALTWADVDLATGVLQVHRTITRARDGREVVGTTTKSGKDRTLPLAAPAVDALRGQRARVLALRLAHADVWTEQDLVFPTPLGAPWLTDHWRRRLAALCTRAGVPRLTPHGLRHTAASLLASTASAAVVRDTLGHASMSMTDRYVHSSSEDARRAADTLARTLAGGV